MQNRGSKAVGRTSAGKSTTAIYVKASCACEVDCFASKPFRCD